jgi:zinc protease
MKNYNKILFILLLTGFACFNAWSQKETPPEGGTPKDFILPEKKVNTLPNGLTSTMVEYGSIPKVNISIIIKSGNANEDSGQVWLADLTARLMEQGTATMNFKEISEKAAGMGGEVSINVGPNNFNISGSVLSEFGPDLVNLMAGILMNPAFPASELDRIKNDLKRQLKVQESVPQNQAQSEFYAIMYPGSPYGRFFPTEEMLDSYTVDMAKDFYNANLGAKRTHIFVVGKFDEIAVSQAIDKSFSGWKEGPDVDFPASEPITKPVTNIIDRPGAPQTTIMLGLPTITPGSDDYIALSVANSLLGGSFGSRITSNIREDKGYTYSPYSFINNNKGGSFWCEQADVTAAYTGASLNEISKEIEKLQDEAPSSEELSGIQNYQAGIFVLRNSSPQGIIGQLNFLDLYGLPDTYLTNQVNNIYAVTPEKVQEMAKKYFNYDKMSLVMVGDKKMLDKQMKEMEPKMNDK